jgi:hypothetical protein
MPRRKSWQPPGHMPLVLPVALAEPPLQPRLLHQHHDQMEHQEQDQRKGQC